MASRSMWNQIAHDILSWLDDIDDPEEMTTMECNIQALLKRHVEAPSEIEAQEVAETPPQKLQQEAGIGKLALWLMANVSEGLTEDGAVANAIAYMDRLLVPKRSIQITLPQGEFIGALTALEWVLTRQLVPVEEGRDELWAVRKILRNIKRQQEDDAA